MNFNGSESVPDLNLATFLAFDDNTVPIKNSWIAEWQYPSGVVTRRIANRQGKTNIIFKMKLEPVPAGDPCSVCWGIDKPFGPGGTPETITVVVEGVEKGPGWAPPVSEPPNGTFALTQLEGNPCQFSFDDVDHTINLIYIPPATLFSIVNKSGPVVAFADAGSTCDTLLENTTTFFFINGTATLFIPPAA